MIYNFDYFDRYERPELLLCNTDDTMIGMIQNAENLELTVNFNEVSQISYKINYSAEADTGDDLDIYACHIERRQVFLPGVGYFIITDITEHDDGGERYKDIIAKSCEYELNNINVPYINGTYCLWKADNFGNLSNKELVDLSDSAEEGETYLNKNCLLYEIMKCIPSWSLEQSVFIDNPDYEELAKSFRTFESSDETIYSFLKNTLQDSYSCFVTFDIENRKILIRRYEDVFKELPVILSKANVLDSCEVSTTIDDYVNSLLVEGTDGVSIAPFNPMGTSTLYNFKHDIDSRLITGELKEALEFWQKRIDGHDASAKQSVFDPSVWENKNKFSELENLVGTPDFTDDRAKAILADLIGQKLAEDLILKYDSPIETLTAFINIGDTVKAIDNIIANVSKSFEVWEKNNTNGEAPTDNSIPNLSDFIYMPTSADDGVETSLPEANYRLLVYQSKQALIEAEITKLESKLKGYNAQLRSLQTVTAEEDNTQTQAAKEQIEKQINIVNSYIKSTESQLSIYRTVLEAINGWIEKINQNLSVLYYQNSFQGAFKSFYITQKGISDIEIANTAASELYSKLTRYFKQQTYQDNTIIITDAMSFDEKFKQEEALYNSSKKTLDSISEPSSSLSIDAESFVFDINFKKITDELGIGSALYAELPNGDVPLYHLSTILINFDDSSCQLTFGNRVSSSDPAAIFSDIQNTAVSAANIVASERVNWGTSEEKISQLMQSKNADIDTTYRAMKSSVNDVNFGDEGLTCFVRDENGNVEYGFQGANGTLMFLEKGADGSLTSKAAVGRMIKADGSIEYGFYGDRFIAHSISADKLAVGAVSKGTNLIRNGSFEAKTTTNNDGWEVVPYWEDFSYGYREGLPMSYYDYSRLSTDPTCIGANALEMDWGSGICQKVETIYPGIYILSFYVQIYSDSEFIVGIHNLDIEESIIDPESLKNDVRKDILAYRSTEQDTNNEWVRKYYTFKIDKTIPDPTVFIWFYDGNRCYIDGIMLEKGETLNEYSPHTSETYAKYTNIDDNGVSIYNGKISIFNKDGNKVLSADPDGNLTISGILTASTGSNIAGWLTKPGALYKKNKDVTIGLFSEEEVLEGEINFNERKAAFWVLANNNVDANGHKTCNEFYVGFDGFVYAEGGVLGGWRLSNGRIISQARIGDNNTLYTIGMDSGHGSSLDNVNGSWPKDPNDNKKDKVFKAFFAGEDDNYRFYVTNKGELFAKNATIEGTFKTQTTIGDTIYNIKIQGESIEFTNSDDKASNNFKSGICFAETGKGMWEKIFSEKGEKAETDLALVGSHRIIFGVSSGGNSGTEWMPICEVTHGKGINIGTETIANSLCFRPASNGFTQRALLGDKSRPWDSIYMKTTAGTAAPFAPRVISYVTAGGLIVTTTVLCYDWKEDVINGSSNLFEKIKNWFDSFKK